MLKQSDSSDKYVKRGEHGRPLLPKLDLNPGALADGKIQLKEKDMPKVVKSSAAMAIEDVEESDLEEGEVREIHKLPPKPPPRVHRDRETIIYRTQTSWKLENRNPRRYQDVDSAKSLTEQYGSRRAAVNNRGDDLRAPRFAPQEFADISQFY